MKSKKALTHIEIEAIINAYLSTLAQAQGQRVADETEVRYHKWHFYIRPQGCSPEYFAVALKPSEIQAMTYNLNSKGSQ